MSILVVPGVALAALSIWLMVQAINRHPRWRPSALQFRVGAAILVVALPWWILAIVVWFAWNLLVSDFSETFASVLEGLRPTSSLP